MALQGPWVLMKFDQFHEACQYEEMLLFLLLQDPKGGVDFKTLGSLLSAKLIEEVCMC